VDERDAIVDKRGATMDTGARMVDPPPLRHDHARLRTRNRQARARTMDWDIRPLRAQDLEVSAVTDGFVVASPDHGRIHFLNPTAAFILEICDGNLQASEMPDLVAAAFQLESPPVGDVETCLASLLNEGLVVSPGAPVRAAG
jgi:hypothetical protein